MKWGGESFGAVRPYYIGSGYGYGVVRKGDSSVFVLSRTGHFRYSFIHNSVNIIGRTFMLHLHGSCHMCFNV